MDECNERMLKELGLLGWDVVHLNMILLIGKETSMHPSRMPNLFQLALCLGLLGCAMAQLPEDIPLRESRMSHESWKRSGIRAGLQQRLPSIHESYHESKHWVSGSKAGREGFSVAASIVRGIVEKYKLKSLLEAACGEPKPLAERQAKWIEIWSHFLRIQDIESFKICTFRESKAKVKAGHLDSLVNVSEDNMFFMSRRRFKLSNINAMGSSELWSDECLAAWWYSKLLMKPFDVAQLALQAS